MDLMLALVLDKNEIIPGGSTIDVNIKGERAVLPVDKDFTVTEVLAYVNMLSPSLNAQNIVKLKHQQYAVVVPEL